MWPTAPMVPQLCGASPLALLCLAVLNSAVRVAVLGSPPASVLPPPYQGPVEIHLLPHSHQDAGFIVTYSHVRDELCDRTYETIFECLRDDPTRTFNVAEVNFFSHWFDSKNASVQDEVRRMVHETKQYGFCEGGWVQPDEGATNYLGRINQATLGQEWLKARLDVSPTAGWHMDPFGNSAISPLLFDGYGFDAHVVSGGRLPTYRLGNVAWGAPFGQTRWHWQQQLQNVWQGAGGAAVMQHIIEGMYMELSGDPDWPGHGYLWESGLPAIVAAAPWASEEEAAAARTQLHSYHQRKFNEPPPLGTSPPVNSSNLARLSADLVRRARNNTQPTENTTRPRAIMIPWGGDWTFSEDAHINFNNMDQIVKYINSHSTELNATIIYSTLDRYLDIVHGGEEVQNADRSKVTLPVVQGTFMGNNDDCCQKRSNVKKVHSCWTGYYSSFPALKFALRKLDTSLRHAEILAVLATAQTKSEEASPSSGARNIDTATQSDEWEAALGWGRHTQGIMQHHDAITGTGGSACDVEYHNMIRNATVLTDQVLANATAVLLGETEGPLEVYSVPAAPPLSLNDSSTGTCDPDHISSFIDCHPKGGEAGCLKMGCCWTPSSSHPYCYKPNPTGQATPDKRSGAGQWPTDDGTVLTLDGNGSITLIASNPLAWDRNTTLAIRIFSRSSAMSLTDPSGNNVKGQLAPPEPWNTSRTGYGSHRLRHERWAAWASQQPSNDTHEITEGEMVMSRLIIESSVPALGTAKYILRAAVHRGSTANVKVSEVTVGDGKLGFILNGSKIKVSVTAHGLIDSAQRVGSTTPPLPLRQDFALYWGNGGRNGPSCNTDGSGGDGGSQSDAYVFSPQGPASSLARLSPAEDRGFWPAAGQLDSHNTAYGPKPLREGAAVAISGPLMEEVSAVFAVGNTSLWQGARVYNSEADIELAYLVSPLASNQDVISRFSTSLVTGAMLHADEAGWAETTHSPRISYDSVQSKIGCNYHPISGWAALQSFDGSSSVAVITDRARGAASLGDGSLEYILHRHATGGNGRGPSDGDKTAARGSVRVLTAATHVEQQLQVDRAQAALQHAHPVALLYRHDGASDIDRNDDVAGDRVSNGFAAHEIRSSSSSAWEPMTEPLPHGVHLFGLGRRAFLAGGGHVPDYVNKDQKQGVLRLQNLAQPNTRRQPVTVDTTTLFRGLPLGEGKLEERTLSLSRRPDEVNRRSWAGAGLLGEIRTPSGWRSSASNSSKVELGNLQIRSFLFDLQ